MKPKPFDPVAITGSPNLFVDSAGRSWHRCRQRVLYADTDRSQVVYHANYLRYFEFGRASLMRDFHYPYKSIEDSGFIYPIIEIGLNYYAPLGYDDCMWIYTRPAQIERVKLRFDYVITPAQSSQVVCKGFTRHCATNRSGRPVGIDSRTADLWRRF